MRLRQANINGSPGWCVDFGIRDGKRRREYFTARTAADKAFRQGQKDAEELGRRWSNLKPHERLPEWRTSHHDRTADATAGH
jgi:hypothetical protein